LRIGYTLAPEELIQAMIKVQSQSTSNPIDRAVRRPRSNRGSMTTVRPMLAEYGKRRKRIVEGLRAIPGVTCEGPVARFYAFRCFRAPGEGKNAAAKNCSELSKLLLEKAHVAWLG